MFELTGSTTGYLLLLILAVGLVVEYVRKCRECSEKNSVLVQAMVRTQLAEMELDRVLNDLNGDDEEYETGG